MCYISTSRWGSVNEARTPGEKEETVGNKQLFYFFNLQVISLFVDPPSALHSASMADHTAAAWDSGVSHHATSSTLSLLDICSAFNKSSIRCLSAQSFSLEKKNQRVASLSVCT